MITVNEGATHAAYSVRRDKGGLWLVIFSPVANCQFCSFRDITTFSANVEDKEFYQGLSEIRKVVQKKMLLIDIHQVNTSLHTRIKDYIISSMPYDSTNGSKMCMYLINLEKIKQDFDAKKFGE